jgi:hypothetical protein
MSLVLPLFVTNLPLMVCFKEKKRGEKRKSEIGEREIEREGER